MSVAAAAGVTLVLGGARSGKSAYAEGLVESSGLKPVYLATGRAFDGEMEKRIASHKQRRGDTWQTIEEPIDLTEVLEDLSGNGQAVLVDCLTLWLTNLMLDQRDIDGETGRLCRSLNSYNGTIVLVSNEVGLGIVPENDMARVFRDHAGRMHQHIASLAETVWFVAAGLPLKMKG